MMKSVFSLPQGHNALVYPFIGEVLVGQQTPAIPHHHAAVLTDGTQLTLTANAAVRLLVLAAKPIGEPIVQYGPFVMNTVAEIDQAIRDYQAGTLTDGAATTLHFS
ncbi:MAG: pirin-like C-terminal cupin domain-containing protein [Rheinheimera sp.]|nr:pirin-like C-terminal cupin domain-containing protein [Rheinheimera sp.]